MKGDKHTLMLWAREALAELGGRGSVVDVSKHVWEHHRSDLEEMGDLLYTWQYDLRWAAYELRRNGQLCSAEESPRGVWELQD